MANAPTRRSFLAHSAAQSAMLVALNWPTLTHQLIAADPPGASGARIKVGQIGTAHSHATKLEVFRRSPDYEVAGIVEPNAALRERAAAKPAFQNVPWMTTDELLAQPGLQLVLVETGVPQLLDAAAACIAAGKHVHLDKPAGESFPQYQRLLAAAADRKLLVQMGYMFRYNPAVVLLKQFLRDGWLGDVFQIDALISSPQSPEYRKALAELPGGIIFELGCHLVDLVVAVLGKPDRVQPIARHSAASDDALLDNMMAVFEYPRALATLKSTALEVGGHGRRHFVVCGTSGTFQIQPFESPKVRFTLDRARGKYEKGTPRTHVRALRALRCGCCRYRPHPTRRKDQRLLVRT